MDNHTDSHESVIENMRYTVNQIFLFAKLIIEKILKNKLIFCNYNQTVFCKN